MTTARDKELEKIQPGLGDIIRRALGRTKEQLDEAGIEHKQLGPVSSREDLIDVIVLAVKSTMAQAVEIGQKAEGDAPAIDLHQIAGEALDQMLDVPEVALDTAEAILAVDDEPEATDAPEGEAAHEHAEHAEAVDSDKALKAFAALTQTLIADQGAVVKEIKSLTASVKAIEDLPARMATMEASIKAIQAEFTDQPRASQAKATEASKGIQEAMEQMAAQEKAKTDHFWPTA